MNKSTTSAIFLAITLVSTAVYASSDDKGHKCKDHKHQAHKNDRHKQFSLMDTNNDGLLSKEELLNFHDQRFTLIDADGDGLVSKDEIKAYRKKQRFMKMDTNEDGVISESEMTLSDSGKARNSQSHNKHSRGSKSSTVQ